MEREEIVVTVGGVVCIERTSEEDVNTVSCLVSCTSLYGLFPPLQYVCSPPDNHPGGLSEEEVVVRFQPLSLSVATDYIGRSRPSLSSGKDLFSNCTSYVHNPTSFNRSTLARTSDIM